MSTPSFRPMRLAEVVTKDRFAIVDGPFGTQLHASEYTEEGVPVVRVVNVSFEGRFLNDKLVFIDDRKAKKLKRSKVLPGDIIVAKTGATIGKSGIFPSDLAQGIIASSCIKISIDDSKADKKFVGFLIQSFDGQRKIIEGSGGSTRKTINTKPFAAIEFNFPSLQKQTKIAEILSTVDQAIQHTKELLVKQKRIRSGLIKDLLTRGIDENGNPRSEETHEFKDSPLGRIPVEWSVRRLDSVAEFVTSGSRGWAQYYSEEGAIFIRISNLTRNHINMCFDDIVRVNPKRTSEGKRTSVVPGDLLISITADLGIIGIIPDGFEEAYVNQHIALIRLIKSRISPRWVGWFLEGHSGQSQLEKLNESGAKAGLNLPAVRNLLIPDVRLSEQERIVSVLDATVKNTSEFQCHLTKLHSLRIALMQDLLSGKVRVTQLIGEEATA